MSQGEQTSSTWTFGPPDHTVENASFFGVYEEMQREKKRMEVMAAGMDARRLLLDTDRISSGEYLAAYLYEMGVARTEDIKPVLARFKELDADGSGFLDKADIVIGKEIAEQNVDAPTP